MAALSRYYAVPLAELQARNPGLDPRHLEVGTPLEIPPPLNGWPTLEVATGETATQIAQRLGVPLEVLNALNPGLDLDHLESGQCLTVPRREKAPEMAVNPVSPLPPPVAPPTEVSPPSPPSGGDWEAVTLADGRRGWAPRQGLLVPSVSPLPAEQVVELAQRFLGTPYRWGGVSPNGVDCSGFVQEVFRLAGYALPRLADEQFQQTVPVESPQPGDLLFFTTYLPGPSHVGISLGGQEFVHASSSRGVIRASLEENYFKTRYLGARRWMGGVSSARIP